MIERRTLLMFIDGQAIELEHQLTACVDDLLTALQQAGLCSTGHDAVGWEYSERWFPSAALLSDCQLREGSSLRLGQRGQSDLDEVVLSAADAFRIVHEDGRLAGIVSAIFAKQSDANIGVNFAVSIELARMVTDALMTKGTYRPPASGMALKPALAAGETGKAGAEAVAVTTDGAAALAGVKVGDRILYAGDRRVLGPGDVRAALALLAPGENLALRILRDGEEITLELQPR